MRHFGCAAITVLLLAGQAMAAAPAYKTVASIPLGAGERWDLLTFDPGADRVYIAHGDHVTVVDAKTRAVVGSVGTFAGGTHGVAIASGVGYTDDGKAGVAVAFDPATLKAAATIPAAPDADAIVFDPSSGHVFVVNGDSGSITVVDPKSNKAMATITIGSGLEAAVADGKGLLFVDGADTHDIVKIDTARNTVVAHYPMPDCVRPHGIAMDVAARRVFATCVNKVMTVMDADTGRIVANPPIGGYSDGAAFDPVHKRALSSNGDGTLSVVQETDPDHFTPLEAVKTVQSGRTIALDPATGTVFIPAADIAKIEPPAEPGGRPKVTYASGSLRLLVLEPTS